MARNHYAVFGLGSFGAKLAVELGRAGNAVVVVDIDRERVDELREKVTEAIIADVSNEEVVRELNVSKFDAVILGMSSHFEDQVLALTLLKQEGARKVLAKANTAIQERILYRLGADEVIQPEQDVAERISRRLSMANITDLFEFKGSAMAEVSVPGRMAGKSLRQLDLRNRSNVTVLLMHKPGCNILSGGNPVNPPPGNSYRFSAPFPLSGTGGRGVAAGDSGSGSVAAGEANSASAASSWRSRSAPSPAGSVSPGWRSLCAASCSVSFGDSSIAISGSRPCPSIWWPAGVR